MATQLSNLEIAMKVMEDHKGEITVREIATKAAVAGLLAGITIDAFLPRLSASLTNNVKRADSMFARVKNARGGFKVGTYRLRRTRQKPAELPTPEPADTITDTGFVGRGGEYAVMSELLFRGFNVSLMSVDKGIDVVAANDQGKYFHIQVKTSQTKNGVWQFTLKRKAFDSQNNSQTFYIFALRRDSKCDFLIMPNSQLANYMGLNVIRGADTLNLRIVYDTKTRKYTLNGGQDVTLFANRFGQIC